MTTIKITAYNYLELVKAVHTGDKVTDDWIHRDKSLLYYIINNRKATNWWKRYLLSLVKIRLSEFYDGLILDSVTFIKTV